MQYVINVVFLELKAYFCSVHVLSFKKTRQQNFKEHSVVYKQHCSNSFFPFGSLLV